MTAARNLRPRGGHRMLTVGALMFTASAVLPACSFWAPQVTAYNYAPSDGINAEFPDLKVRNLLVVGGEADGSGAVSATLLNQSDADLAVRLVAGDGALDQVVDVPADGQVTLVGAVAEGAAAGSQQVVVIDPVGVPAGAVVSLQVATPGGGSQTLEVPVMAAQGAYAGFVPTS